MSTTTHPKIKVPVFSINRIWTIATGTMTQLVRMKTFYFLIVFAVLVTALGHVDIMSASSVSKLQTIKKVAFGTMDIFAWLYAVVATALLIPRDLEDRTLYTILSKPVLRIEYLVGKLFLACLLMLYLKQRSFMDSELLAIQSQPYTTEVQVNEQLALIKQQGARPALAIAALASFLKASVVAAMTILISTFASSSLFTIITSIFFFLSGHAHGMMSDFWLNKSEGNFLVKMLAKVFKLLIPDFQLFSFSEGVVSGATIIPQVVLNMSLLTCGYLFVFLLISLMIFMYKEF
jgi:ABC-2 type transport system permease protein